MTGSSVNDRVYNSRVCSVTLDNSRVYNVRDIKNISILTAFLIDWLGLRPPNSMLDLSHYHQLPDPGRDSHMWFRRCVCHFIEELENNVFRLAWPGVPASAKTRSTAKDERTEILTVPAIGAARWNNRVRRSGAEDALRLRGDDQRVRSPNF